ncbi:cyclic nucleotide-binding-like protein, partial [Pelagophyceae sp. CCMP2097]
LRSIPLFQSFTEAQLETLHGSLEVRAFAPGARIIEQGAAGGNEFYIIARGRVRVSVATAKRASKYALGEAPTADRSTVAVLAPGDYFGERALVLNEPRASTCVADGAVTCLVLDRNAFEETVLG